MNVKKIYAHLFALTACIMFTGCQDDIWDGGKNAPAEVGDEIVFGGSLKNEDIGKTRTVYGDKGTTGTEIKWYSGDKVRIYCAEARSVNGNQFVDYSVDNVLSTTESPIDGTTDTYHNSSLTIADDEPYGLQWGSEDEHYFYGVYPSPDMYYIEGSDVQSQAYSTMNFDIEKKTFTGFLPSSQEPLSYRKNASVDATTGAITYTMYPAMRYAYMLAQQMATAADGKVSLIFKPIVTAVEITIENTMAASSSTGQTQSQLLSDISMVGIESTEGAICGKFTTAISGTAEAPVFTNTNTSTGYNTISVPVMSAATVSGSGKDTEVSEPTDATEFTPITLRAGDKLKFTVFMLPNTDLNTLKINIMIGSTVKTATLSSTNMKDFKIYAQKKNFITNIPLGYDRPISTSESNWISSLSDATDFCRLSIPGAGGVYSHALNSTTYDTYMEQTLGINDLWNRGIRCFEFAVDMHPDTDNNGDFLTGGSTRSLGDSPILANGVSTGVILSTAINEITTLITNNPREFAIVIITYYPNNSRERETNYGRNGKAWSQEFNTYWSSVNTSFTGEVKDPIDESKTITLGTALLTSKTKVGDARGKLFCIARPTAIGADPWWYSMNEVPANAVCVAGWGFTPDQWYARGYVNGNRPYNVTKDATNTELSDTEGGTNYLYPIYSDETPDKNYHAVTYGDEANKFMYNVFEEGSEIETFRDDIKIMAQEWRRVCGTEGGFTHTLTKTASNTSWGITATVNQPFTYHWAYSYDEKKSDIVETFNKAIVDNGASGIIYINSLCGYYIDANYELSYQNQRHRVRFYAGITDTDTDVWDDTQYNLSASYTEKGNIFSSTATVYSYDDLGGAQGDIKGFAEDINDYFYDYIKSVGANNISGATGIILMDRIAKEEDKATNPAGYYLSQIILNNNFRQNTATAKALSLRRDTYEDGDVAAAPQRREASESKSDEISIVWE